MQVETGSAERVRYTADLKFTVKGCDILVGLSEVQLQQA